MRLLCAFAVLVMSAGCSTPGPGRSTQKALSKHERFTMYLNLAAADISSGEGSQALQVLAECKALEDDQADLYYLYSLAYLLKNDKTLALTSIRRAIELKPDFSKAKNTEGRILIEMNRYDEAEKPLKEAANDLLFKEAYLAKANLGIVYFKKMNPEKAEPYLTAAIQEGRGATCVAGYYRGMIEMERNDLDRALADFNLASRSACSRITDAHLAKGQVLIRMKKYDLARAKMMEIQQLFPTSEASDKAARYLKEIP